MLHVLAPYVWPVVPRQLLALSPTPKDLYTEQRIPHPGKQLEIVFGEKTGQIVLRKNWTWVYNCTDQRHFYMDSAPYPSIFLSLFLPRSPKSFPQLLILPRHPMKILCGFKRFISPKAVKPLWKSERCSFPSSHCDEFHLQTTGLITQKGVIEG